MNILFYRWNVVNEKRVKDALVRSGYTVTDYVKEHISYDMDAELISGILFEFHKNKCDCIFSLNYFPFLTIIAETIKKNYISWIQDSPHFTLYSPVAKSAYNHIFTFDRTEMELLRNSGLENIYHLPLASALDFFCKENYKIINSEYLCGDCKIIDYKYDISFVGSTYGKTDYDRAVSFDEFSKGYYDALMQCQHKIYGASLIQDCLEEKMAEELIEKCNCNIPPNYLINKKRVAAYILEKKLTALERHDYLKLISGYCKEQSDGYKHISDAVKLSIFTADNKYEDVEADYYPFISYDEKMPEIFRKSRINLNFTARNIHSGVALRVFDVLASKGFLISSYQPEIDELFEKDKDLVMFSEENELIDLIDYYLHNEEDRNKIAENGYNKVKELFNYDMAIGRMMKQVFK